VDVSSRFQLGGLLGVDTYKGFSWDNALGPGVDLLSNWMIKTPQALTQGKYGEAALQALPIGSLRNVARMITDGGEVRNKDDKLMAQLSGSEQALAAVGFVPKRVSEMRKLDQMKQRAEAVTALDQRAFHNQMADLVIQGDLAKVHEELLKRWHTVEGYDPRAGAQMIAEAVQRKQIPYDPVRDAAKVGATYAVGQMFPPTQPQISEVQREQQKNAMVGQMGFFVRPSMAGLREASFVDQLMAQNPRISRSEAKALLDKQFKRQVQYQ